MKYAEMAITVTDLNKYIKEKIASDEYLNHILIKGEISNFKNHYTGHLYFTLKDENCLVKCIMFKSYAQKLRFMPKDGMKVFILGSVSVFERDGVYQIYVQAMEEDGVGDLYAKYQELKNMLEKEGLFDEKNKKKIPLMPKIVVSTRRNPNVYIRLFPVPVQGEGAAEKISYAIKYMNDNNLADVLILARGGGSLEDLWPFNEEIVARAIYESKIPVISAVGHETDFSISDFVADLRAPTPSAAAELAVPNIFDIKEQIVTYQARLKQSLINKLKLMKMRYDKCMASNVFKEPVRKIQEQYQLIDQYIKRLENIEKTRYEKEKTKFIELVAKLDAYSPLKTLSRGYSIIEKDNKIVKTINSLEQNDEITIQLVDGKKKATIN